MWTGQILRDVVEVRRWAEYFEHLGTKCGRCQGSEYKCISSTGQYRWRYAYVSDAWKIELKSMQYR